MTAKRKAKLKSQFETIVFTLALSLFNLACTSNFEATSLANSGSSIINQQQTGTTTTTTTNSTTSTTISNSTLSRPSQGSGGALGNTTGTCGSRNYALHVPASYNPREPIPIVVAMHGLGDSFQNFNAVAAGAGWHQAADQKKFIYMTPASTNPNRASFLYFNSDNSANWTSIRSEMTSLLDCIYHGVGAKYNIETLKIYWIGFSEGASFTNVAANYLSKEIKAVAIYGGSAPRMAAEVKRLIPIYYLAGTADFNYSAIVQQSGGWSSHPHIFNWVGASHSFSTLNMLASPSIVYDWLSNIAAEPVQSGY